MSKFGAGVFDNETSYIYRDLVAQTIVTHWQSHLFELNKDAIAYYERYKDETLLGILSVLHLLILEVDAKPPKPNDVRYWYKELMRGWDKAVTQEEFNNNIDYFNKRRLAVANTFDSMMELSDNFWLEHHDKQIHTWKWQPILIDTDGARRFASDRIQEIGAFIQAHMFDAQTAVSYEEWVITALHLFKILSEKCDIGQIDSLRINVWKTAFMQAWCERRGYGNESSDFVKERYEVIESTFDDLIHLSRNWIPRHQRKAKSP
jgi:hypothetical protein